jgi:uncharacterized delta-60 repeat protein
MQQRLIITTIYILIIGLTGFLPTIKAAPGDLDLSFSGDGLDIEALGSGGNDDGYAVAIQPNGKLVVAGSAVSSGKTFCSVTRFNPDGSLDPTFDGDGIVLVSATEVFANSFVCSAVALQTDGKIVVAGSTSGSFIGTIVRLNPNGSLDLTFDGDGRLPLTVFIDAVAIQADGRIIAAGYSGTGSSEDFAVVRYNPDGSPDPTFDGDGRATTDFFSSEDIIKAVTIQPDGKIIAAGYSYSGTANTGYDYALARYNPDGSLDPTFDADGRATTHISIADRVYSVALQSDGKIVAAGYSGGTEDFSAVRYNPNGSLDPTFDGDGKLLMPVLSGGDICYAMSIQSDGKIVMAGSSSTGSGTDVAIVRLNPDGSPDASFDGDGKMTTPILNGNDFAYSVAFQTDGRIVAAGYANHRDSNFNYNEDTFVVRYNPDGSLDPSFDLDGKSITDLGVESSVAQAVAIQPDGKIVAAGSSHDGLHPNFSIVRYNADGSLDPGFDGDGKITTVIGSSSSSSAANAVAIQSDGKIVVAGFGLDNGGDPDFAVVRYNPDGSLDLTFDGDGKVLTPVLNLTDIAQSLAIQPDGKIVVGGYSSFSNGGETGVLVRYNADGSLDTSFDGDGKLTTLPVSSADHINAVAIQTDGKIVAAGTGLVGVQLEFLLLRYNPNGTPDTSFNGSGRILTPILNSQDKINSLAIQPDGKIVAAGSCLNNSSDYQFALARYNPNGSLDPTFDGDGKATTVLGYGGIAESVAVQADGRIIAAGYSYPNFGGQGSPTILRYNANGTLNTTYGTGGKVIFNFYGSIFGMALDASGRAVVAGASDYFFMTGRVLGNVTSANADRSPFDFDGDRKTDISVFRPGTGTWWINNSLTNLTSATQFGVSSDRIVPADFTGDGRADIAVWRPSIGAWYILRSEDSSFYLVPFGTSGDVPVPADFDGDGEADVAVFRPSTFTWYINKSSGGTQITTFGAAGDVPVTGDYDGDGKSDIAIFRPLTGEWWINKSSTSATVVFQFGNAADKPVQGDYTGDGKADVAIWRPSTGEWFILRSEDFSYYSVPFGASGDIPAPGDYDGDGRFDTAVFRPSGGTWYINRSDTGILITNFGVGGDKPVASAFVP